MAYRKECARIFCPHNKDSKVRFEVKKENFGFKTEWLCLAHAVEFLRNEEADAEEQLQEAEKRKRQLK